MKSPVLTITTEMAQQTMPMEEYNTISQASWALERESAWTEIVAI
jgi:hypothetical protein